MKKYLLILMMVGLFFGCSEMTAEKFAEKENKAWIDYLIYNEDESARVFFTPNNLGTQGDIIELDSANNIVGARDRDLVKELGRDDFTTAKFSFWYYTPRYFYYDVEEAGNLAVGSLADCVSDDDVSATLTVSLVKLLDKPENAGIDIGDEVFKIKFYSDEAKTDLMDTFTFIL